MPRSRGSSSSDAAASWTSILPSGRFSSPSDFRDQRICRIRITDTTSYIGIYGGNILSHSYLWGIYGSLWVVLLIIGIAEGWCYWVVVVLLSGGVVERWYCWVVVLLKGGIVERLYCWRVLLLRVVLLRGGIVEGWYCWEVVLLRSGIVEKWYCWCVVMLRGGIVEGCYFW